ncbi:MAG TPA: HAD-IA family hydrolase [Treponemataceae bacterium]|nr:HAD-IA family hydrolase [Treponemataceae bacterium]
MLFIFDMGGVVARNVQTIPAMAKKLSLSSDEFFICCGIPEGTQRHAFYDHGLLAQIQSGAMSSIVFWNHFLSNAQEKLPKEHPGLKQIPLITAKENLWATCFKPEPIKEIVTLIETLKRKGHRVVCGTNTLDVHYEIHNRGKDYEPFHKVYASHLMGIIKPDTAFWTTILDQEKMSRSQTIFIDDNHPNIDGAESLGIRSFLFTSPELLIRDFSKWTEDSRT